MTKNLVMTEQNFLSRLRLGAIQRASLSFAQDNWWGRSGKFYLCGVLTFFANFHATGQGLISPPTEYPITVTSVAPSDDPNASAWLAIRSWRLYKSVFPNWNATITQIDVPGPGRGRIVACGNSGFAAYLSDSNTDLSGTLSFSLGVVNLRHGNGIRLSATLPSIAVQVKQTQRFDETSNNGFEMACSSDRNNLSLELISSGITASSRHIFQIDIVGRKIRKIGEIIESNQFSIANSLVNYAVKGIVLPNHAKYDNDPISLQRFDAMSLFSVWQKPMPMAARLRVAASSSGLLTYPIEGESVSIKTIGTARNIDVAYIDAQRQIGTSCVLTLGGADYLQMLDEDLVRVNQPNIHAGTRTLEKVERPESRGKGCEFTKLARLQKNKRLAIHIGSVSQYGGGGGELVELSYLTPSRGNTELALFLGLHKTKVTSNFYSLSIPFKGINEEDGDLPLIWALPGTGKSNATFAYGPLGRGTALIHLWKH